jgi:hypothetical protein
MARGTGDEGDHDRDQQRLAARPPGGARGVPATRAAGTGRSRRRWRWLRGSRGPTAGAGQQGPDQEPRDVDRHEAGRPDGRGSAVGQGAERRRRRSGTALDPQVQASHEHTPPYPTSAPTAPRRRAARPRTRSRLQVTACSTVASNPTVSMTAMGSFDPGLHAQQGGDRRGNGVVRIIENTAAASVDATTAPISPAVTGSTSSSSQMPRRSRTPSPARRRWPAACPGARPAAGRSAWWSGHLRAG